MPRQISFARTLPILAAVLGFAPLLLRAEEPAKDDKIASDKKALTALQTYVGDWKGAGTLKGSTAAKDGWSEETGWVWEFKGGHAAIVFKAPAGKFFSAGKIDPGEKDGAFVFTGTLPDGKTEEKYAGALNKGDLEVTTDKAGAGRPEKITFELVAKGKRMVMTYYVKGQPFAEVGFTRKGSGFGKEAQGPECIVTGGLGSISVSYKGQSYFVCCGGCKDEFNDNPEKVLAEYKARKEKEKAEKK